MNYEKPVIYYELLKKIDFSYIFHHLQTNYYISLGRNRCFIQNLHILLTMLQFSLYTSLYRNSLPNRLVKDHIISTNCSITLSYMQSD